jgi:hypothetical protein
MSSVYYVLDYKILPSAMAIGTITETVVFGHTCVRAQLCN